MGLILAVMGVWFSWLFEPSRSDAESKSDSEVELLDTEEAESKSAQSEVELPDTEEAESKSDSEVELPKSDSAVKCELPHTEEAKWKRDSAECRAFRECFSDLADGITDPGRLAVQLYSKKLVGPDIRTETQKQAVPERTKIVMLLSAVEDQIMGNPATNFREFLNVLQNEPSLQHLATRLKDTRSELACVPQPTSTSPSVDTYASYLKSVYKRKRLPVYDKWPLVN